MKSKEQQAAEYAKLLRGYRIDVSDITNAYLAGYNAAGNKWVDVARYPEQDGPILVLGNDKQIGIYYHTNRNYDTLLSLFTHWQPLPSTPPFA